MQGQPASRWGDNKIWRIQLDPVSGVMTQKEALFNEVGAGGFPLDVTAQGDLDSFPGTIWVADIYAMLAST